MRTNPFLDALLFMLGYDDNYKPLGVWQYPLIVLFDVLVALNIVLLIANWRSDSAQRTGRNIYLWIARSLLGAMWYQGTLWKLPLPVSGGFKYWMDQIAHNAAFPAMANFYNDVPIPNIAYVNAVAYASELSFAIALMLGFMTRAAGVAAMALSANIRLGLYHNGSEWPWQYAFLILVLGFLALDAAGRAFGIDAMLHRRMVGRSLLARLYLALS